MMYKDMLVLTCDDATEEQLQELREALEENAYAPLTLPSVNLVSLVKPTYFIAVEPDWYEGHYEARELAYVFRTEASLTRTKRYCRVMGWELIAYGEMQVFGDTEYLSSDDMRLAVRRVAQERREQRRRWAAMSDEERKTLRPQHIEFPILTPSDTLQRIWAERQPCRSPVYEWKGIDGLNGVKVDG